MKVLLAVIYLLFKKDLAFINSPLQFICCTEYLKKFENNFNILFIGYTTDYESIKKVENFYKSKNFKLEVIYLNEILYVNIFHFILNLRKYFFFKFNSVLIGDYRYYLHKKILSISTNIIFVDDGLGTLYFNRFFKKKIPNSIFFTSYPLKYNVDKIIENNFTFLKSLYKYNKKKIKGSVFLLPGLSKKKFLSDDKYFEWINNVKKKVDTS